MNNLVRCSIQTSAVCFLLLVCGCGPHVSDAELGEVINRPPELPESKTPITLGSKQPANRPATGRRPQTAPTRSGKSFTRPPVKPPAKPTSSKEKAETESLKQFIRDLHTTMTTGKEDELGKAIDEFFPIKKDLEVLFPKDAELLWKLIGNARERYLNSSEQLAAEFKRKGKLQKVEVYNVRKQDVSGRYQKILKTLPKEIPIYRIVTTNETRGGGSSSFLWIDGRWIWYRGLEGTSRLVEGLKNGSIKIPGDSPRSKPKTSEPKTSKPKTSEPKTSEPETSKPETSKPDSSQPGTGKPASSKPTGG